MPSEGPSSNRGAILARPRARLALLLAVLITGFLVFGVFGVLDRQSLRDTVDAFGPLAPAAYVVIAAILAMLLLPGPVLAAVSGLLFGTAVGTIVALASAVLTGVGSLLVARHLGRDGVRELGPERLEVAERLFEGRGIQAVIAQRLIPGLPDAPFSYAAGLVGIGVAEMAIGTAIGSAPRAFSYTAIGASLDDPTGAGAIAGVAVLVLTAIAGGEIGRRALAARR